MPEKDIVLSAGNLSYHLAAGVVAVKRSAAAIANGCGNRGMMSPVSPIAFSCIADRLRVFVCARLRWFAG